MMRSVVLGILVWACAGLAHAQIIGQPYNHHAGYGHGAYGFGYSPIISGTWYWDYYGLTYPSWSSYGYGYDYDYPTWQYAVIAYSPSTGQYGSAWGYTTRSDAAWNAVRFCGADDCESTVWVANGCAAVAVSEANDTLGWAYASQRFEAQRSALQSCQRSQGEGCRVLAWACSG